jgi:hypothetical protein
MWPAQTIRLGDKTAKPDLSRQGSFKTVRHGEKTAKPPAQSA